MQNPRGYHVFWYIRIYAVIVFSKNFTSTNKKAQSPYRIAIWDYDHSWVFSSETVVNRGWKLLGHHRVLSP